jgi:hypothetical protein
MAPTFHYKKQSKLYTKLLTIVLALTLLAQPMLGVVCNNKVLERIKNDGHMLNVVLKVSSHGKYDICKTTWN